MTSIIVNVSHLQLEGVPRNKQINSDFMQKKLFQTFGEQRNISILLRAVDIEKL